MNARKIVGLLLIVLGVLGLVYGTFTYTSDTHSAKVGSVELSVKEKETVNVPVWGGVGAITIGALLIVMRTKRV
jgi:5,10-methylene-tetrahydrofolate dehydrogenase/methenyl tetrahydrofolate cyclohydrolase